MKILFTYDYGEERMNAIRKLGYEIVFIRENEVSDENIPKDIEAICCYNPFGRFDITKLEKLKWIQVSSTGYDHVPMEFVKKNNVIVTNNKGGYSKPIGEWIVMSILNIYKDIKYFVKKQEEKNWKLNKNILELVGKNVLFLGTGTVASEGAKRLQGFECNITGINSNGRDVKYFDRCVSMKKLMEELPIADVVVSALPYNDETHHLINDEFLKKMKEKSILINVSRGKVIDEKSVMKALDNGKFLGVSMDVFENEPLTSENPLWSYEKIYVSPHNSWISEMRNERRFSTIYQNMENYMLERELINRVNI